jgi:hypothetical protein
VLADPGFDEVGIEVADDDHRGVLGPVDALVERAQPVAGGRLQRLDGADRQPFDKPRAGVEELYAVDVIAQLVGIAHALLGQHHALLALDRRGAEGQLAGGLSHQHQRGVEQRGIVARQVELVQRGVEIGRGVGVGAEREPFALEQVAHLVLGHAGRAVERHVLDEVRVAEFVLGLGDRPASTQNCTIAVPLGVALGRIT